MKILITNDDGIRAPQLLPLVRWAQKLGDVTVVAPKAEQSGKSHGVELHKSFEVKRVELAPGIRAYSVDSTPADCVRCAVLGMHEKFDLVISGINRGLNVGTDIVYSGTVGAIFEAAALGIQGVAFSTTPGFYDQAAQQLDKVWAYVQSHELLKKHGLYNINIPGPSEQIRITRQGGPYYTDDFLPVGDDLWHPKGRSVYQRAEDFDVDTNAVLTGGLISITPLTMERTDLQVFTVLKQK